MKIRTALAAATLFAATALAQTTMNIHTKSGVQKIAVTAIDSVTFSLPAVVSEGIHGNWKFAYMFAKADSAGTVETSEEYEAAGFALYWSFDTIKQTAKYGSA